MNRQNMNYKADKDEFIFLPGHPEADSKGYINIHNGNLLAEMTAYIMEAQKTFHEFELKSKRKIRTLKF